MIPCGEGLEQTHNIGRVLLVAIWVLLPMFFTKEPITWPKRIFLMVWYLGAALAAGIYCVTR